jgi:hypothetical protein
LHFGRQSHSFALTILQGMDRESTILFIGILTSVYLWFMAVLVWGIWIQRYVVRSGRKAAPFALTLFTGWGVLVDYRRARSIAAEQGHTPWFLRCFAWLAGLGMAGLIATMAYLCITSFL